MKKSITAAMTRRMMIMDMKKIKTPQRPLFSKANKMHEYGKERLSFTCVAVSSKDQKTELGAVLDEKSEKKESRSGRFEG